MGVFGCKTLMVLGFASAAVLTAQPAKAELYDLTTGNPSSYTINDGIFSLDYQHPTGTGVIDPFLRLQQKGFEQGYNTDARNYKQNGAYQVGGGKAQFDEKTDPNYTRNLTVGELGTQVIDGKTYVEFFLDINESASTTGEKHLITLDQLEIYVSNTPSLDKYSNNGGNNASGTLGGGGTSKKIYDLDSNEDNWVNLNYLLSGQGSGSSDMSFLLDKSLFDGYSYVYLYSQFGDATPDDLVTTGTGKNRKTTTKNDTKYESLYSSDAGFEEWFSGAELSGDDGPGVPEPSAILLMGVGLALGIRRLRRN